MVRDLYRLCWEVELSYKATKSRSGMNELTTSQPHIARTLVYAALIWTTLAMKEKMRASQTAKGHLRINPVQWMKVWNEMLLRCLDKLLRPNRHRPDTGWFELVVQARDPSRRRRSRQHRPCFCANRFRLARPPAGKPADPRTTKPGVVVHARFVMPLSLLSSPPRKRRKKKMGGEAREVQGVLARAQAWESMLGTPGIETRADLARQLGVSRARVTQALAVLTVPARLMNTLQRAEARGRPVTERTWRRVKGLREDEAIRVLREGGDA